MSAVLDGLDVPVVQAPMGGGASTVALAAAVSNAGGLGFLAGGYRTAAELEGDVSSLRERTSRPFGVNVFVPAPRAADPETYVPYLGRLAPLADEHCVALGEPRFDDDEWERKLDVLERLGVPAVSFVFGCPSPQTIERLDAAGSETWVTVTDPAEARQAADAGADVLVAQGHEAGAHRAAFDDAAGAEPLGLLALVQLLTARHDLPVVAAGGIASGAGLAAVLAAGAAAGQLGTSFLLCPEAGTAPVHRDTIRDGRPTRLTRAFTGRLARTIDNDFARRFGDGAPSAYPELHHATAPLRAAARERGDAEAMHLWAGQAHELARELPAGELVARLGREASEALAAAGGGGPAGAWTPERARRFAEHWLPAWSGNRPELLASFYTDDAFYADPAVPDGVSGRERLLGYFRRLLARYPDWEWRQRRAVPLEDGFLNHWEADIPTGSETVTVRGVCSVQLRDDRIYRNEVFFDRTELGL